MHLPKSHIFGTYLININIIAQEKFSMEEPQEYFQQIL